MISLDDYETAAQMAEDHADDDEKPHAVKDVDDDDMDDDDDDNSSSLPSAIVLLDIEVKQVGKAENDTLHISLPRQACVSDLKQGIANCLALLARDDAMVPVDRQRLIFCGRLLRDGDQSLESDLHMKTTSQNVVHLAPLPKGMVASVRTERELGINNRANRGERRRHTHRSQRQYPRSGSGRRRESGRERRQRHRMERTRHPYSAVHPSRVAGGHPDIIYVPNRTPPSSTTTTAALANSIAQSFPPDVIERALRELLGAAAAAAPTETTATATENPSIAALLAAALPVDASLWSALQELAAGGSTASTAPAVAAANVSPQRQQPQHQQFSPPAPVSLPSSSLTVDQFLSLAQLVASSQPQQLTQNDTSSWTSSAAVMVSLLPQHQPSNVAANSVSTTVAGRPVHQQQPQPSMTPSSPSMVLSSAAAQRVNPSPSQQQQPPYSSSDGQLLQMLEQIARNASDMASVLRLLQQQSPMASTSNPMVAASTPNNDSLLRDFITASLATVGTTCQWSFPLEGKVVV